MTIKAAQRTLRALKAFTGALYKPQIHAASLTRMDHPSLAGRYNLQPHWNPWSVDGIDGMDHGRILTPGQETKSGLARSSGCE